MTETAMDEEHLELIVSLDDIDAQKDEKTSPAIQQSTSAFTVNEVIAVLERILSSTLESEAEMATKILKKTRGKKYYTTLERFVFEFVEAFNKCNDTASKLKSESIRAIRLEKEFAALRSDQNSQLYDAWKQLAGDAHDLLVDTSTVISVCSSAFLELRGIAGKD